MKTASEGKRQVVRQETRARGDSDASADKHRADSGTSLRKTVQDRLLLQMIKRVAQRARGWVVLVLDDHSTKVLSSVARMSDLTDCGVSIVERLELDRQPLPDMHAVYFVSPSAFAVSRLVSDFQNTDKPTYKSVHLFFSSQAPDDVFRQLQEAPVGLMSRLRALQEMHVDFLALERAAFSLNMPNVTHSMVSPALSQEERQASEERLLHQISRKLVSTCVALGEYPYVRHSSSCRRIQRLANLFQTHMNEHVAKDKDFAYASDRGTLLLLDRGDDLVSPFMHEATFQAMVYDLLEVENDQVAYPSETNSGQVVDRTAILSENDALWTEFRHTHIADVSTRLTERMKELSSSAIGASMSSKDTLSSGGMQSVAAAIRELPEYRETLSKLSQHLYLASKAMDVFTQSKLLDASKVEQSMAIGVDDGGKRVKWPALEKVLLDVLRDGSLSQQDRFRVAVVFFLTQDAVKYADKRKVLDAAELSKEQLRALENFSAFGGRDPCAQHGISRVSEEEIKAAKKQAAETEYSNARYDPSLKRVVRRLLDRTLDEESYPYVIAPPPSEKEKVTEDVGKKRFGGLSLRRKTPAKLLASSRSGTTDASNHSRNKAIVFVCGGATYSELRAVYELRQSEERDVFIGSTSFVTPGDFVHELSTLHEVAPDAPTTDSEAKTRRPSVVMPVTSGEIHLDLQAHRPATHAS